MKTKVLVILGPTATGKSDLAVEIAKEISSAEIISADSRQVYTGLDIGTGKITKKEMRGVPHHLLDVADARKSYSVVKFSEDANAAIAMISAQKKLPIICGGTGFYIEALIDGVIFPDVPPNAKLRKTLSKKTSAQLLKMLQKLDPARAKSIEKENSRRIIRAIEIASALGKVPKPKKIATPYLPLFIGLTLPNEELKEKIKTRLDKRIKKGMIKEVETLHTKGLSWKRMGELGLEYRYVALYLQDKITLDEIKEKLATEIWRYAKRQITWFKRDKRIHWFDPKQREEIKKEVRKFLG